MADKNRTPRHLFAEIGEGKQLALLRPAVLLVLPRFSGEGPLTNLSKKENIVFQCDGSKCLSSLHTQREIL